MKNALAPVIFAKPFTKIAASLTKNVLGIANNVIAGAKRAIRISCNKQGSFTLAKINYSCHL